MKYATTLFLLASFFMGCEPTMQDTNQTASTTTIDENKSVKETSPDSVDSAIRPPAVPKIKIPTH